MRARAELRQNGARRDDSAHSPLVRGTSAVVVRPYAPPWCAEVRGDQGPADAGAYSTGCLPRPNAREPRARILRSRFLPVGPRVALHASSEVLRCPGTVAPWRGSRVTHGCDACRAPRTGRVDDATGGGPAQTANRLSSQAARRRAMFHVKRCGAGPRERDRAPRVCSPARTLTRWNGSDARGSALRRCRRDRGSRRTRPTRRRSASTCCRRRSRRHCAFRAVVLQRSDRAGFACSGPLASRLRCAPPVAAASRERGPTQLRPHEGSARRRRALRRNRVWRPMRTALRPGGGTGRPVATPRPARQGHVSQPRPSMALHRTMFHVKHRAWWRQRE